MRFLVDAQLPARLARLLTSLGHDAVHTSQLPDGNRTPDGRVAAIADAEQRVLVTKDGDFRDSHLLRRSPERLLIVGTGNISNDELLDLVEANVDDIVGSLTGSSVVELRRNALVVRGED
ncbi:MAG: DUF5615 family PIN-like protein [Acidimicrobiales bacterium]